MNAPTRLSAPVPLIPDSAPFTAEQRAWLNGFFAAIFASEFAPVELASGTEEALVGRNMEDEDDGAPWHDPSLSLVERMKLAEDRPLHRRMMAAMAQQDCGQCGSNCEDYGKSIASRSEARLNLCSPGGKETARMLKTLVEELSGGGVGRHLAESEDFSPTPMRPLDEHAPHGFSRERPVDTIFLGRKRLSKDGSEKAAYHIEFDISQSGLEYSVGDSFGIFPRNDAVLVERVLAALHAPASFPIADKTLGQVLAEDVSLGIAPDMLFELLSYVSGGARRTKARALARGEDPDGDAATFDVLAALEKLVGRPPDPEAFVEALDPLQPRLYSISSSPKTLAGSLTLAVDHVRYAIDGRERLGVASTFLARTLMPGDKIRSYIQRAHDFALPLDGDKPIIMVGPGTGIAPFRAFLQERLACGAKGPAWLFFGHQRRVSDFFYEDELRVFLASGTLTRLSLAWSRDTDQKIYVQDRMREESADLWSWLDKGAHLYVCGDAKRMAADVEKTLTAICEQYGGMDSARAKTFLADLRVAGRYQTDVY
jgi:sulfite reductase (NADPH) flavoprotein alpha-component